MNFEALAKIYLTAAVARLLGWVGASLATVGIQVIPSDDSAAKITSILFGLLLMAVHWIVSHFNLKKAIGTPTSTPTISVGKAAPLLAALLIGAAALLSLSGCASTANLTTTQGSPSASVDVATSIGSGASVTSANTTAGTTVSSITGNNLTLSLPATATGTVSAKFQNTLAVQLTFDANGLTTYAQTLGTAFQKNLPTVIATANSLASLTSAADQIASSWGLTPANSSQQKTFNSVVTDLNKAASSATLIENSLTGLQTTGETAATVSQ